MAALATPVMTDAGLVVSASRGSVVLLDVATGDVAWAWSPPIYLSGITTPASVDGRQMVALTNAANLVSFVVPKEEPDWVSESGPFARLRVDDPKTK